MKTLLVYYSLEGNTKLIADAIAEEIDCDVIQLIPKNDVPKKGFMKYVWGGKQVVLNENPELEPFDKNFDSYDLIIIGSPVWAGSFAPAFNTLFSQVSLKNKKVVLFCCYAGTEGKIFDSFKKKLQSNRMLGELGFKDPLKNNTEENIKKAKHWIRKFKK